MWIAMVAPLRGVICRMGATYLRKWSSKALRLIGPNFLAVFISLWKSQIYAKSSGSPMRAKKGECMFGSNSK